MEPTPFTFNLPAIRSAVHLLELTKSTMLNLDHNAVMALLEYVYINPSPSDEDLEELKAELYRVNKFLRITLEIRTDESSGYKYQMVHLRLLNYNKRKEFPLMIVSFPRPIRLGGDAEIIYLPISLWFLMDDKNVFRVESIVYEAKILRLLSSPDFLDILRRLVEQIPDYNIVSEDNLFSKGNRLILE